MVVVLWAYFPLSLKSFHSSCGERVTSFFARAKKKSHQEESTVA